MKRSHVLPGLVAVVLAVGAAFASGNTVLEAGYEYSLSTPCEFVRNCNNIPNAPVCKAGNQEAYQMGATQCTQVLRNYP